MSYNKKDHDNGSHSTYWNNGSKDSTGLEHVSFHDNAGSDGNKAVHIHVDDGRDFIFTERVEKDEPK